MKAPNTTVADQVRMVNLDVAQDETKVENQSMAEDEAVVESQPFQSERGSKRLASATFMNSWWSEIIFCIGGLVISMIIVVVLWLHDQKPQPQWPLGITLNALLALLTSISKASFMISMAEVISQWKWNIYDTPEGRPFYDFTLIDLASRGFWGSCLLLRRFKWRHPVSLAAFITIVSVMISPLTQQAIEYPTRLVGSYGPASVGVTRHWTPLNPSDDRMQVEAFITQALYSGLNTTPTPIEATCPTARCTFEPYESLAMCVKIADVSNYLETSMTMPDGRPRGMTTGTLRNTDAEGKPTPMYYLMLPNNVTFDHNYPVAFISTPGNGSLAFRDDEADGTALMHSYIIHTRSDNQRSEVREAPGAFSDPEFGAFEVMMHLCVNEYETVVNEGQSWTTVRRTRATLLESVPGRNMTINRISAISCDPGRWDGPEPLTCMGPRNTGSVVLAGVNSDRCEDGFRIDASLRLEDMAHSMAATAYGMYSWMRSHNGHMTTLYTNRWSRKLMEVLYGKKGDVTSREDQTKRLEVYWGGVATSLSNFIRTTNQSDVIRGTAWETEVYVNIRWGWLSFLAADLALATFFIAFTTFVTHRLAVPVLKSFPLAAFLAPDEEAQRILGPIKDLDSAKEQSKLARMRFDHRNLVLVPEVLDAEQRG